jgi:hypothetical protein
VDGRMLPRSSTMANASRGITDGDLRILALGALDAPDRAVVLVLALASPARRGHHAPGVISYINNKTNIYVKNLPPPLPPPPPPTRYRFMCSFSHPHNI